MAPVINLNNEVVKMRKDVKKVKVLIIRKLIRQMAKLKSKKGTDELIQKNQRRAQRLLEEVNTIKKLKPDVVTKTALQTDINFDDVCKQPNSTIESRAIARLATHPIIKKKISSIKDALRAFLDARKVKAELDTDDDETSTPAETVPIARKETERCKQGERQKKQNKKSQAPALLGGPKVTAKEPPLLEDTKLSAKEPALLEDPKVSVKEPTLLEDPKVSVKEPPLLEDPKVSAKEPELLEDPKVSSKEPALLEDPKVSAKEPALLKVPKVTSKVVAKMKSDDGVHAKKAAGKSHVDKGSNHEKKNIPANESDSDIEDSDKEEKEYFDDSTEERFHKKGSDFGESDSDSDGDFFIGKVRRTKKKKSSKKCSEDQVEKEEPPKESTKSSGQSETQKAITAPKTVKLESVFYSSLSDRRKSSFIKRENKPFPVGNKKAAVSWVNKFNEKPQAIRSTTVKSQSTRDSVLHPSWEASRKRKEQSQIAVFQGKKIVFDD